MATATLALRRKGRVFGHGHAWQILLDGKPNGSIADGDAARLPAEAGRCTLRLSSGAVHQPGAVLRRRRRAGGQLHLPRAADLAAAAAAVIVPGLWISLRQESSPPCC